MAIEISMAGECNEGVCVVGKRRRTRRSLSKDDYVSLCSVSLIIVGLHVLELWGRRGSGRWQQQVYIDRGSYMGVVVGQN